MLDDRHLILCLPLGEWQGLRATIEHRTIVGELWNIGELLRVCGLGLCSSWRGRGGRFRSARRTDCLQSARAYVLISFTQSSSCTMHLRATSFAACARLILGMEVISNGSDAAVGSLMYDTSLVSKADSENTDSDIAS